MSSHVSKAARRAASSHPFVLSLLALSIAQMAGAAEGEAVSLDKIKVEEFVRSKAAVASAVDAEQLARSQPKSLAEALDALPGVNAGGSPRPGGQTINVWGYSKTEQVQVQLDGANQSFSKYQQGTSFIEPELLGRVDVIKGAQSPYYGNGGFGAVVRAETKSVDELLRPGQLFGGFLKTAYQSNGGQFGKTAAAYGGGSDQPVDILAYITQSHAGDGKTADGAKYMFSGGEQSAGMLKLGFRPAAGHQFKLSLVRQDAQSRTPWAARAGLLDAPRDDEIRRYGEEGAWLRKTVWREQETESGSAEWRYADPARAWLDLTVSYSQSRRYQHDTRPESTWKVDYGASYGHESWVDQRSRGWEIRNRAKLGERHALTVGAAWSRQDWNPLSFLATKVKNKDYNYGWLNPYGANRGVESIRSAYVVDEWRPLDALAITPSLRFDQVTLYGRPNLAPIYNVAKAGHDYTPVAYSGFSPRLALQGQLSANWRASLDLVHTWRAPSVDEVYAAQIPQASLPATSRQLRPETLNAVYLGLAYDKRDLWAAGDRLELSMLGYHQRVSDNIYMRLGYGNTGDAPGQPPKPGTGFYRNLSGYQIHGYELSGDYQARNWFGGLSLSSTMGDHDHSLRDPWGASEPVVDIPPRKLVLTAGVKLPRAGLTFGLQGKFVRKQDRVPMYDGAITAYAMPPRAGYALANFFLSWQPRQGWGKDMEARLAVDNLTNRAYRPYLTEGAQGMGRSVRTSLSWRF